MKSDSGRISIGASAKKLDVDNRISLRIYYRIANNLIKQADIYRQEKNIIDLYVMLLRFSSLITETIPQHRDYQFSLQRERSIYKRKILDVFTELETLKPDVQRKIEELDKKSTSQLKAWRDAYQGNPVNTSMELPSVNKQFQGYNTLNKVPGNLLNNSFSTVQQHSVFQSKMKLMDRKFTLNIPRPKDETLSRHSILGPNGLHGHWRQPTVSKGIQYPTTLDLTPVEIPSLQPSTQNGHTDSKDNNPPERERSVLEEVLSLQDDRTTLVSEDSGTSTDVPSDPAKVDFVREPSPPPVRAEVQDVVVSSQLSNITLKDEFIPSEAPVSVHISTKMMETFMRFAKSNTDRNLETCGVLAGSLKNRRFNVTALIIPKQESTSDSCHTTNEEEIFDYQDKQSLFPLGWIHTHPTQSCFMSSIDVHTHYSYQIMLPEAIAIVMAPRDSARTHGIFRLTTPGGMSVIKNCPQRGFHPHPQPLEGGPIYDHCSDVYIDPSLKFDVVDLR